MAAKIERVGAMHPEVCQGTKGSGPCEYRRVPGSEFCHLHGSAASQKKIEAKDLRNYRLSSMFGDRAVQMSGGTAIKSLSEEIGLLRSLLEVIYNSLTSQNEALMYSDKIMNLSKEIRSQVETWQKLQERNRELMARDQVIALFDQLIERIVTYVQDPDILRNLADDAHQILTQGME